MKQCESPYNVKEIINREDRGTYLYQKELIYSDHEGTNSETMEMEVCYTPETGEYIGNVEDTEFLCNKKGITKIENHSVGWCEKEQKWYGWSHRAIYGFGIGSEVEFGDCAYYPRDEDDFLDYMINFWSDEECHSKVSGKHVKEDGKKGVLIEWTYNDKVPNKNFRNEISSVFNEYPDRFGKGAWQANTLDDAKQMAQDFAENVS